MADISLVGSASDESGAPQFSGLLSESLPSSLDAAIAAAGGTTPGTATNNFTNTNAPPIDVQSLLNVNTSQPNATSVNFNNTGLGNGDSFKLGEYSTVSNQSINTTSAPGKRIRNPLGEFSSYTYQLSLYMITPDAYDAFIASGRTKINVINNVGNENIQGFNNSTGRYSGAFVVAQSGGINNQADVRAPGLTYDFAIDDLRITNLINGKETGSASQITEISFNIREPYGFRFLTNLREAGDALFGDAVSPITATSNLRQTFILGIRFYGYDASGRIMQPDIQMAADGIQNGKANYVSVDPTSENGALFQHYIDITITELKFKIDGKMVTYNVTGAFKAQQDAFKISRGLTKKLTVYTASTVGQAVEELMKKLNNTQQDYVNSNMINIPTVYKVVWAPNTEEIWTSNIVSKTEIDKYKHPFSDAQTTEQVNAKTELESQTTNTTAQTNTISEDTPIVQAITDIVKLSEFLEKQLSTLYTTDPQADPNTKSLIKQKYGEPTGTLSWFKITPQISNIQYDDKARDYAYDITYYINKYSTPMVDSPVTSGMKVYPGPHKRYDYWYTGKNTEVLSFEQTFDNTWIQVVQGVGDVVRDTDIGFSNSGTAKNQVPSANPSPIIVGLNSDQPRVNRPGAASFSTQNSFLTALYDSGAWLKAKVNILGDPDFLPSEPVYNEQIIYDAYYNNQFTINSSGGQVFIEINFQEPVDYQSSNGLMSINEQIAFVKYPPEYANKIKGVSFMVLKVESNFSNGTFKQTLELQGTYFGTKEEQNAEIAAINEFTNRTQGNPSELTPTNSGESGASQTPRQDNSSFKPAQVNASGSNGQLVQPTANDDTGPSNIEQVVVRA